jgi:hypothetical protein
MLRQYLKVGHEILIYFLPDSSYLNILWFDVNYTTYAADEELLKCKKINDTVLYQSWNYPFKAEARLNVI